VDGIAAGNGWCAHVSCTRDRKRSLLSGNRLLLRWMRWKSYCLVHTRQGFEGL
jgi:hypothetical protein